MKRYPLKLIILLTYVAVVLSTFNALRVVRIFTISDIFFILAAFLAIPYLILVYRSRAMVPAIWFFGVMLLSTAGAVVVASSPDITQGLSWYFKLMGSTVLIPLVIVFAAQSPQIHYRIILAFVFSATINTIVALLDQATGGYISHALTHADWHGRASGLTAYPNHFGLVCAMALPLALALSAVVQKRGYRAALNGTAALILVGVLLSGSRAALIGAVFGSLVIFVEGGSRRQLIVGMGFGVGGVLIMSLLSKSLAYSVSLGVGRLFGDVSIGNSDSLRIEFYKQVAASFQERPLLGQGLHDLTHAHDIYLQLVQAGGLVLLVGFLCYIFSLIYIGLKNLSTFQRDGTERKLTMALLASVGTWLVIGLAQNMLVDRYIYVPVGLLVAARAAWNVVEPRPSVAIVCE